jgi:hypothetical protein
MIGIVSCPLLVRAGLSDGMETECPREDSGFPVSHDIVAIRFDKATYVAVDALAGWTTHTHAHEGSWQEQLLDCRCSHR